ncbi:MAG: cyclase family protein [Anaerolineae bacterium]|nr:cyclase family protein [Thermoflexales bacterium]MDW8395187.1 cyclase family protein [Anaerolineae bacterium]
MCVPECQKKIAETLSRRQFLKGAAAGAAATAAFMATPVNAKEELFRPMQLRISKVVDLTYPLPPNFPTFGGAQQLTIKNVFNLKDNGYNLNEWVLNEHTGTHMDAPFHFSDQQTADQIPVENLVGPLVVIDIREKAGRDPDALVTEADIRRYERRYGRIPFGAIVAMWSGWDEFVKTPKFRNADAKGVMHFPGFALDAVEFLLANREVKGIMVDTLSLDHGPSTDFAVHYKWLPTNRWGMECVANLGKVPARGATVIVGSPKIVGATGGPSRVIALI